MTTLINLLPDIRQDKARNNQRRRMAKLAAFAVSGVSLGLVLILFLITLGQKYRINSLSEDIKSNQAAIDEINDLQQILTTQRQLSSLAELYQQRVLITRLYGVLSGLQPREIGLQSLSLDAQNTLTMTAQARNFGSVTRFVKALQASNVSIGSGANINSRPHFSNIKLATVTSDTNNLVSFSVTATMSPEVTNANK